MGVFLEAPNKTKDTHTGSNDKLQFTAVGMQGWRKTMEDSHITELDLGDGNAFFGVFDGHGGKETALFVEKHFCKTLKGLKSYTSKNFKTALEECFMKMD
jgi:serine/threonine protein phosphatase PrpC